MPRRKQQAVSQDQPAAETPAQEKKWAEPYRPIVSNAAAGMELGENRLANLMVFSFAKDPGPEIKGQLKKYGYFYDTRQKTWTVNATPTTREIARRLAGEFAANQKTAPSVPGH